MRRCCSAWNLVGVGTIVVAAIVASANDWKLGLVGAAAYRHLSAW